MACTGAAPALPPKFPFAESAGEAAASAVSKASGRSGRLLPSTSVL